MTVARLGDTDGDGLDDLGLSATGNAEPFGAAYVVLGPVVGELDLANDAGATFLQTGDEGAYIGAVRGLGDVDGDGLADVGVTQYGDGQAVDVVLFDLGPVSGDIHPGDHDAQLGSEACNAVEVVAFGDLDGDGDGDLLVGDGGDSSAADFAGAIYLVSGRFEGDRDLCSDPKILGTTDLGLAGWSVAFAGDVDADTRTDLLVGAPRVGGDNPALYDGPGAAYLLYGPAEGTTSLADADVVLHGAGDDRFGWSVSGAGDLDGDGLADIVIGGPGDDDGGTDAGAAWIFSGATLLGL